MSEQQRTAAFNYVRSLPGGIGFQRAVAAYIAKTGGVDVTDLLARRPPTLAADHRGPSEPTCSLASHALPGCLTWGGHPGISSLRAPARVVAVPRRFR
jgi:hypothetical protein